MYTTSLKMCGSTEAKNFTKCDVKTKVGKLHSKTQFKAMVQYS